jgi:hypothetical protein
MLPEKSGATISAKGAEYLNSHVSSSHGKPDTFDLPNSLKCRFYVHPHRQFTGWMAQKNLPACCDRKVSDEIFSMDH